MPTRLVALDEGSDIPLDRAMVVVGRHPLCDVRLDSLRISRHHCCMTQDKDELVVRDLGSTNGIRINGERVERGRLRTGDELSIAHIRYRLENESAQDMTIADANVQGPYEVRNPAAFGGPNSPERALMDKPLGEVVRGALGGMPDKYRIQVIVQMKNETDSDQALPEDAS
jgi:pSer/pThr/pTyr-binding forkhead associated (FHA) protein